MAIDLKLLSLNVRGLRESCKRRELFRWFKRFHDGNNCFIFLQETHSNVKDEIIWEREWGSKILFSHGTNTSKGVAILFPQKYNYAIMNIISIDGRKVYVTIKDDDVCFTLINVYCPTKDNVEEHFKFVNSIRADIDNCEGQIVLGGDFNFYLNVNLDKDVNVDVITPAAQEMNNIMSDYDYIDIWRVKNPDKRHYTWRRRNPLVQSRLDYWFLPTELIYNVIECGIKPSIKTDHSLISLHIQGSNLIKRGPGLWKFNEVLLHDKIYVDNIKSLISTLTAEYNTLANLSLKWDLMKTDIRNKTIAYCKQRSKEKREYEDMLFKKLENLDQDVNVHLSEEKSAEFDDIKYKLERINAEKTEGIKIRSRAQWVEENERNSKLFINMEKRNYEMKHITKLKDSNDCDVTDPKEILKLQKEFYEKLYSNNSRCESFDDFFLDNLPHLSQENCDILEAPVTMNDITNAVKSLKGGKSPGTDGFTANFYKFFWIDIKDIVLNSLIYAFDHNLLSEEQRRAVLRLIPKHGKDLTYLKHWRPISLLNTDYKILAQVLATRMQKILPEIISKDQNGYLTGRFIGMNIRTIVDSIEYSKRNKLNTLLAFLDFEKAFDKINWEFIDKCLVGFGFGSNFRKWIKIMYTDISSAVINNGFTTQYFKLKCGIRQGCPLSALIFILTVETLSLSLKCSKHVNGIMINNHEILITQLADDMTLMLDNINSLRTALNILYLFQQASGLTLNYSKTEVLQLGNISYSNANPFNLKWVKEKVYALGTWFYKDVSELTDVNLNCRLEMFLSVLKQWKCRNLTWYGKTTVIKSLALAKLNYCISTLEIPKWFTDKVQKSINDFLWDGKPPKIKYATAISAIENGGLRLPDIHTYVMAQKAIWGKRLFKNEPTYVHAYLNKYLDEMQMHHLINVSVNPNEISDDIPLFYKQILYAWVLLKEEPNTYNEILSEMLWLNLNIRINGEMIMYIEWYKKGIVYICDILDENGKIYSYNEFITTYKIKCTQFLYMSFIDAIPQKWRLLIKRQCNSFHEFENVCNVRKFGSRTVHIEKILSKDIYWKFVMPNIKEPSCIQKWLTNYAFSFNEEEWKFIFCLPHLLTKDLKVVEFQSKIIHRVYASPCFVSHFDSTVSELCQHCEVKADICHIFFIV